jgi:hypothetical protein
MIKQSIRSVTDSHSCAFLQLNLAQRIPEAKTIWLFRETLAQAHVVETLFEQFATYLATHGLQPRGGHLLDASLVPVPKPHNWQGNHHTQSR